MTHLVTRLKWANSNGVAVLAGAGVATAFVFTAGGAVAPLLFHQVSTSKWALTACLPAAVLMLALCKYPASYLAAAVVFTIPFVPFVHTFAGVPISGTYALLAVATIVASIATEPSTLRQRVPSALPLGAATAGLALLPSSVLGSDTANRLGQYLLVAALAYVLCRAAKIDPNAVRLIVAAAALSAALQGAIAVREFVTRVAFNPYGGGVASYGSDYFFGYGGDIRPAAAFFDPISLGNALAVVLPLAVAGAASRRSSTGLRVMYVGCAVVITAGLALTLSRMSWIGAAAGLVVSILLQSGARRFQVAVSVAFGTVFTIIFAAGVAGHQLAQRFSSISDPTGNGVITADGDQLRQQFWSATFGVIHDHWLFGTGYNQLNSYLIRKVAGAGLYTHAHSTYFQYAAEAGLLGVFAILAIVGAGYRDVMLWRRHADHTETMWTGYAGAIVAMLVCWSTDYVIRYPAVLMAMSLPFILLSADRPRVPAHTYEPLVRAS